LNGIVERPLRIGEINNRFLQSLWFLHVVILAYVRLCVKYIITDDMGCSGIPREGEEYTESHDIRRLQN
jgi:hypothetical protein